MSRIWDEKAPFSQSERTSPIPVSLEMNKGVKRETKNWSVRLMLSV